MRKVSYAQTFVSSVNCRGGWGQVDCSSWVKEKEHKKAVIFLQNVLFFFFCQWINEKKFQKQWNNWMENFSPFIHVNFALSQWGNQFWHVELISIWWIFGSQSEMQPLFIYFFLI